jgi:hypothetical protein
VDALLEALGLEMRPPDTRFFEDLFLRFQRRVACETLTRPAGKPQAFDAEAFFAEWGEKETGLVGAERAHAFEWLAKNCGFESALVEGRCWRPWEEDDRSRDEARLDPGLGGSSLKVKGALAHRAVFASIGGRRILADAGFPLPVLLSVDAPVREIPTGFGMLTLESPAGSGDFRVTCDAHGEETELLRLDFAPNPSPLPLEEISRSSQDTSPRQEAHGAFAVRVLDGGFRSSSCRAGRSAWRRSPGAL